MTGLFADYLPAQVPAQVGPSGWDSTLTRQLYGDPNGSARTQVLNYGGGTQTTAMIALCITGRLPWPDRIVMADTGREASATWEWLHDVVAPALANHGRAVEIAPHSLATEDLLSHRGTILMPMWTTKKNAGEPGQLPTYCSDKWKTRVVQRHLADCQRVDHWIGYSADEASRMAARGGNLEKWRSVYPLLDLGMTRDDCQQIVRRVFGKPAPKSSCYMCPHRGDSQWRELRDHYPADWAEAVHLDYLLRQKDPHVYTHRSGVPLDMARLDSSDGEVACSADGGCWT